MSPYATLDQAELSELAGAMNRKMQVMMQTMMSTCNERLNLYDADFGGIRTRPEATAFSGHRISINGPSKRKAA